MELATLTALDSASTGLCSQHVIATVSHNREKRGEMYPLPSTLRWLNVQNLSHTSRFLLGGHEPA